MIKKDYCKDQMLSDLISQLIPFTKPIFKRYKWLSQFINFSTVGLINMILSYIIYALLIYLNVHYQIANQLSFWISVLNGYVMNHYWVFSQQNAQLNPTKPIKYIITYGLNMLLGIALLYLYVDILKLNKYIVPFISLPITIPMNYFINKFWVFRRIVKQ